MAVSSIVWLLSLVSWLSAAETARNNSAPSASFLRLRETTLGYHGPQDDFTNLTEIRLGWFGPTNLNDPLTGDLWWAANFAVREANERRSAETNSAFRILHSAFPPLPIRLVPRWAVDPWGTGVSQLARMVYDEQPLALLGSVDSATTHLAEQVVAKANLPLVSPIVTDKSVTLAGVSWMFSCAPSDDAIARTLVDDVLATLKDRASLPAGSSRRQEALENHSAPRTPHSALVAGLALLAGTDHESRMTTREVLKEFSRRGRLPDFRFDVSPGARDITRQLAALEASRPDAVLIIAGAEDAGQWVRHVRGRLGACAIFGNPSMGRTRFLDQAGTAAEGVRFPLLFARDTADTNAIRLMARFVSERQHLPDYTVALTYDATRLLIEAIRRAGLHRARIREELVKLSPWPGIAGPIAFDGTGQNTRTNLRMGTIRNGAVVPTPPITNLDSTNTNTAKL